MPPVLSTAPQLSENPSWAGWGRVIAGQPSRCVRGVGRQGAETHQVP